MGEVMYSERKWASDDDRAWFAERDAIRPVTPVPMTDRRLAELQARYAPKIAPSRREVVLAALQKRAWDYKWRLIMAWRALKGEDLY